MDWFRHPSSSPDLDWWTSDECEIDRRPQADFSQRVANPGQ
jgi:hypothetical protein